MKGYVITIMDNERSVQVANRCIASADKFDVRVSKWAATTPADDPKSIMAAEGLPYANFDEIYSRTENCAAAFLSHYSLWQEAIRIDEDILILEHDAVFTGPLPNYYGFKGCVSLGEPSYGKYHTPRFLGINQLTSKKYFPGAHAYIISPRAAKVVVSRAKSQAAPTDVFFHIDRFPFLQEYYPWPVKAKDSFTTIQSERGCLAKHNYGETYGIL